MTELETKLINACRDGDFLNTIYEISRKDNSEREKIINELILLNNNLKIDVVAEFKKLKNSDEYGNFFIIRRLFEKILPKINSPAKDVMECVIHLTKEAGADMTARILFSPFTEYCESDKHRTGEILRYVDESPELCADFITPAM
ncbi:hypothetical protein JYT31_00580 [Beggiatoa alba]|nr:hypothetical protein [Beggiatoa alba]